MLSKLETIYGKKSDITIEGLQRQFFGYKYDDSKSVVENCMQIQQLAEDLNEEGEEVKESWIMKRILGILPGRLYHFRIAWDSTSNADKNLSKLIERLQLEEDRINLNEQSESSSSQSAFFSKNNSKFQKNTSENNKSENKANNLVKPCYKCGQIGHFKKNCRNKS